MERAWMKHRKKRLAALLLAICMVAGMLLGVTPGTVRAAELPSVYYSGHMQTYGNLAQVKDGTTLGNLEELKKIYRAPGKGWRQSRLIHRSSLLTGHMCRAMAGRIGRRTDSLQAQWEKGNG